MSIYARSFPFLYGGVVTEGHAAYCADNGHATHTVNGIDMAYCPRCGAVTVSVPMTPPEVAEEDLEPVMRNYEVQMPVKGEIIFLVEAYSAEEAIEIAESMNFDDGESNLEQDEAFSVNVEALPW